MATDPDHFDLDTTQTLDELFHQILNQALVLAGAQSGSLMLVDPNARILQIKARLGKPRAGRRAEVIFSLDNHSNASFAARTGRSSLVADTHATSAEYFARPRAGQDTIRSLLSVPIIDQQHVIAVINADADQPYVFTLAHQAALERFAADVAPVIASRRSVVDAVVAIGLELAEVSTGGGIKHVLSRIARVAVQSLGADIVTLYEYDQATDQFLVAGTGPTIEGSLRHYEAMRTEVRKEDTPWIMVHEQRASPASFYTDIKDHAFLTSPRQDGRNRQRFTDREDIESMAALLLPQRAATDPEQEIVGVLFANYRTTHTFNSDERKLLAAFADYAAIAIQNARQQRQQSTRQQEIVSIISAFPASFAASMHRFAGTSQVTTQIIRERLSRDRIADRNGFIARQLARIARESDLLYGLASRISEQFTAILGATQPGVVDLPQVIEQACRDSASELEVAGILPQLDLAPGLPRVLSVDAVLVRVLQDILSNAIQATAGKEHPQISITAHLDVRRNRVRIQISDNGHGVSPAVRDSLFTQILTHPGGGGLSLWYGALFMRSTGGALELANPQPEEGASFVLELPCVDRIDALIMSGDPLRREMVSDRLLNAAASETPIDVEQVATYSDAAERITRHRTGLVILDFQATPDRAGFERVLAACRSREHATRVLLAARERPGNLPADVVWCPLESPDFLEIARRLLPW